MNRLVLTILVSIAMAGSIAAQKIEFTAMGFYQFGGIADETIQEEGVFHPGEALGINGSNSYGLAADIRLGKKLFLELSWDRQPTKMNLHEPIEGSGDRTVTEISNLDVQYYQVGLVYDWSSSTLRPFVGGAIGMVRMKPDAAGMETETGSTFSTMAGIKTYASNTFAFRLQGKMLLSQVAEGRLFYDEYIHHKETFMAQFQLGIGVVLSL